MHYRKREENQRKGAKKPSSTVTKNTEKGIDNKADNRICNEGETLQQILENWETEDLPAVPSSNMKS